MVFVSRSKAFQRARLMHQSTSARAESESYYAGRFTTRAAAHTEEMDMATHRVINFRAAFAALALASLGVTAYAGQQYFRGTLKNCRFGSVAAIEMQSAGELTVLKVNESSKFNVNGASVILSNFAQSALNQKVVAVGKQEGSDWTLIEAWDEASFSPYSQGALNAGGGYVKVCSDDMIQIGNYFLATGKTTKFRKAGKLSKGVNPFANNAMVHVKAELRKGVPHALVVSDNAADVGAGSAGNDRPEPSGLNRPDSAGKKNNSPSERGSKPKYKISMHFTIRVVRDELSGVAGKVLDKLKDNYEANDYKQELFGSLAIDGKTIWSIPEKKAKENKRGSGQTLDVKPKANSGYLVNGEFIMQAESVKITGVLNDFDAMGKSDLLLKVNCTMDLAKLAGTGDVKLQTSDNAHLVVKVVKVS